MEKKKSKQTHDIQHKFIIKVVICVNESDVTPITICHVNCCEKKKKIFSQNYFKCLGK